MNKTVKCPWCGSEMEIEHFSECYAFVCHKCSATAPYGYDYDEAYAAAMRRPLQKPLTLEEACESEEPCVYLEQKGFAPIIAADLCYSIYGYYGENFEVEKIGVPKEIYCSDEYGTKLRCWATKPSDEERNAAKWE